MALCAAIPIVAAFLVYLPVLRAQFVWDDYGGQRELTSTPWAFTELFKARSGGGNAWIFRPVTLGTFLLDNRLTNVLFGPPKGDDPESVLDPGRALIPHVSSLLLHVAATGTVVWLAAVAFSATARGDLAILIAGLFFALHPVHCGNVAWIGARADTLCTVFLLSSLALAHRARLNRGPWALAWATIFFLLALLSKEVAISGLLLLPLWLWLVPKKAESPPPPWRGWVPVACFAGAFLVYWALRAASGSTLQASALAPLPQALRAVQAFAFLFRKIVFPWPLTPFVPQMPGVVPTLLSLSGFAVVCAGAWLLWRRGTRCYLAYVLWFAASCAPSLAVALTNYQTAPVAERYLYLPGAAFALAVGGGIAALPVRSWRRSALWIGVGVLLAVYAQSSWTAAATVWRDNRTLIAAMIGDGSSMTHPEPWVEMAADQARQNNPAEAERAYRQALSPEMVPMPWYRAKAFNGLGDIAIRRFENAMRSEDLPGAMASLREAEAQYTRAVHEDPGAWRYRKNLVTASLQRLLIDREMFGKQDPDAVIKAGRDLEEARRVGGENPEWDYLAGIYAGLGGPDLARTHPGDSRRPPSPSH